MDDASLYLREQVYLREKAKQCRRLAFAVDHADPMRAALEALAHEFAARAEAMETEQRAGALFDGLSTSNAAGGG
jgi:hypothetical protein